MTNKLFVALVVLILPLLVAIKVVYGQTTNTSNTTNTTNTNTAIDTTVTPTRTLPQGAPNTGFGYMGR